VNTLISIRAYYIERILKGSKKYKLKKANPENKSESFFVYIYVPVPIQKVLYFCAWKNHRRYPGRIFGEKSGTYPDLQKRNF